MGTCRGVLAARHPHREHTSAHGGIPGRCSAGGCRTLSAVRIYRRDARCADLRSALADPARDAAISRGQGVGDDHNVWPVSRAGVCDPRVCDLCETVRRRRRCCMVARRGSPVSPCNGRGSSPDVRASLRHDWSAEACAKKNCSNDRAVRVRRRSGHAADETPGSRWSCDAGAAARACCFRSEQGTAARRGDRRWIVASHRAHAAERPRPDDGFAHRERLTWRHRGVVAALLVHHGMERNHHRAPARGSRRVWKSGSRCAGIARVPGPSRHRSAARSGFGHRVRAGIPALHEGRASGKVCAQASTDMGDAAQVRGEDSGRAIQFHLSGEGPGFDRHLQSCSAGCVGHAGSGER